MRHENGSGCAFLGRPDHDCGPVAVLLPLDYRSLTVYRPSGIVNPVASNGLSSQSNGGAANHRRSLWGWLRPGLGIKRWFVVVVLGMAMIGLGLAIFLLDIYRAHPESPWLAVLSMRALPRWVRAVVLGIVGFGLVAFAIFRLNRTLLAPYMRPGKPVLDAVTQHRRLGRGPRVVAIGGGTGLATLLRGLKDHSGNLTAIVTVADDGGSSGRLRRTLGLPPPGDLRNCLAALSDDEDLLTQLFQYRFAEGGELDGHSFGNLFIAALAGVTGSFDKGVMEAGRVLAVRGQVLPSTLTNVSLTADKSLEAHAVRIVGESRIPEAPGSIRHVHLDPSEPPAHPEAIRSLLNADLIVVGPGSLFTSVLPNLLVPDLVSAIRSSRGLKVYVCNVATQPGETDGFDPGQHLAAIEDHAGKGLVDVMLVNDRRDGQLPEGVSWVCQSEDSAGMVPVRRADLVDPAKPWRHDSDKLAETLITLLEESTGPLEPIAAERPEQLAALN
jgi:uncharacterized cofD-like protein